MLYLIWREKCQQSLRNIKKYFVQFENSAVFIGKKVEGCRFLHQKENKR